MTIYLITFLLSLLFIYLGYPSDNESTKHRKIFILLGLLFPCLLAGFRAITVGSDTNGYVIGLYNLVKKSENLFDYFYLSNGWYGIKDYAYLFITFISSRLLNNFHALLFLIELFVIVPIYMALDISKKSKKDVILGMCIFFLFMYNVTFNMARQGIAISFSILGLAYVTKNKKIPAILCLIIAYLFHNTALITIFIYLAYYFITSKKRESTKQFVLLLVYIITIVLVFEYKNIVYLLYNTGIYRHGIQYIYRFRKLDFSFIDTFLYLFMLIMIVLNKKYLIEKGINYKFYLFLAIESLILLQLGAFVQYMERVSFYTFYPLLFGGIAMIGTNNNGKISKNTIVLIIFLLIYWFFIFCVLNIHNTIPYVIAKK